MSFEGRAALVTGGASGIGLATAEALCAAGAKVMLADINAQGALAAAEALRAKGGTVGACHVDVGDQASVAAMALETFESFSGLDILVHCACIGIERGLLDTTLEEWDRIIRVNLTGTFLCAQAVQPSMVERGGGRICNLASMAGRATSTLGGAHYTAAKAGVLGLSRHLAREWASDGIVVNAISPGIVDTPMAQASRDAAGLEDVRLSIPLGRFADPAECAALIAFLVSDEAAYITGANVDIHGGEIIIA